MTLSKRSRSRSAQLIAAFLCLVAVASRADTTPPPLFPPAITAAIDAIAAQPDQCPNIEAIQSLVDGAKDWAGSTTATTPERVRVPAVAAYTALRLQANSSPSQGDGSEPDARCGCIERLSQALAPVDPARAQEVQHAFADAFPQCDKRNTKADAGDTTMQAPAAPYDELPEWKNLPRFGIFGDPTPLCRGDCAAVEPPPAHDASRTAL
jgi:hypothetical protein